MPTGALERQVLERAPGLRSAELEVWARSTHQVITDRDQPGVRQGSGEISPGSGARCESQRQHESVRVACVGRGMDERRCAEIAGREDKRMSADHVVGCPPARREGDVHRGASLHFSRRKGSGERLDPGGAHPDDYCVRIGSAQGGGNIHLDEFRRGPGEEAGSQSFQVRAAETFHGNPCPCRFCSREHVPGERRGRGEGGLGMGSECAPSCQRDSLIHNARVSAPGLSGQLLQLLTGAERPADLATARG